MSRYIVSQSAQVDLISIAKYGDENYGVERSNKYRDKLKKQLDTLAQNPKIYRERWELSPPIRVCPFTPYVIIYTIQQYNVLIVRVRHEREDWS